MMSGEPPAATVTIKRTGRDGYGGLLQPACTDAVSANLKAVKLYRRPRGRDLPEKVLGCPN